MKVSDFSVKAADRVKKQGVAELIDALAAGKVSVSAAARMPSYRPSNNKPWSPGSTVSGGERSAPSAFRRGANANVGGLVVGDPHPVASGGEVVPKRPSAW
jgi:hypothetical protein